MDSIQLFDRRFYHIISVEDHNYKVKIYNYSNKINKYLHNSSRTDIPRISIYESDFIEYSYFTYDYKYKIIQTKRLLLNPVEKNEVFWSKYDLQLNDMGKNIRNIKFKNELNFLVIDKMDEFVKRKKRITNKNTNATNSIIAPHNTPSHLITNSDNNTPTFNTSTSSLFNTTNNNINVNKPIINNNGPFSNSMIDSNNVNLTYRTPQASIIDYNNFESYPNSPKLGCMDKHYNTTTGNFHATSSKTVDVANLHNSNLITVNLNDIRSDSNTDENVPFVERVKQFVGNVDAYLGKYQKFSEKIYDKINNLAYENANTQNLTKQSNNSLIELKKNGLQQTIVYIQQPVDWILLLFSKNFNEKFLFYFSINWLSCNSISVYNFQKELYKRVIFIKIKIFRQEVNL